MKYIIGNWKLNPQDFSKAKKIFNSISKGLVSDKNKEVVICPPFVFIPFLKSDKIKLGAQDCFWEKEGAFTGEISALMLKKIGVKYIILGHSERRKYQSENDLIVNRKIKAVLAEGLKPILCIEKESQIRGSLAGVDPKKVILAFEPVSAIGTGKPYSLDLAKKTCQLLKNKLKKTPVLYGGSVRADNAGSFVFEAGFDGLLIGGASLNPGEFVKIIKALSRK